MAAADAYPVAHFADILHVKLHCMFCWTACIQGAMQTHQTGKAYSLCWATKLTTRAEKWPFALILFLHNLQDEAIQRFEDRCTEANAEIQQLQAALQDASKRLYTAEDRLSSTMESRNKIRKQLEAKQSELATTAASLQAEHAVLKVGESQEPSTALREDFTIFAIQSLLTSALFWQKVSVCQ